MNRLEILVKTLEKDMRAKGIKKKDLESVVNRNTISTIFNQYKGSMAALSRIINYIDSK